MKNGLVILISTFMLAGLFSSFVSGAVWTMLGSAKVHGAGVDHDVIYVTGSRGDFTAIKLFVVNEGIEFEHVIIHFGNGTQQEAMIRDFIPAGGETKVIDLAGHDRVIYSVVFYYKSNPATKTKGKVELYGRR